MWRDRVNWKSAGSIISWLTWAALFDSRAIDQPRPRCPPEPVGFHPCRPGAARIEPQQDPSSAQR